jgi:hypothetical protein
MAIPSRDVVVYLSLGLGVYHGQLDERELGLIVSSECNLVQWELIHQSFVVIHSIDCRVPPRRLVRPNAVCNRAVIAPIHEG